MLPKKIYLREVELDDKFMCERMVSCDVPIGSCNVEYTDLSSLWHDGSEYPKIGEQVLGIDYDGAAGSGTFEIKFTAGVFIYDSLILDWDSVVRWVYISDLLSK